jgi:hypothetical protein
MTPTAVVCRFLARPKAVLHVVQTLLGAASPVSEQSLLETMLGGPITAFLRAPSLADALWCELMVRQVQGGGSGSSRLRRHFLIPILAALCTRVRNTVSPWAPLLLMDAITAESPSAAQAQDPVLQHRMRGAGIVCYSALTAPKRTAAERIAFIANVKADYPLAKGEAPRQSGLRRATAFVATVLTCPEPTTFMGVYVLLELLSALIAAQIDPKRFAEFAPGLMAAFLAARTSASAQCHWAVLGLLKQWQAHFRRAPDMSEAADPASLEHPRPRGVRGVSAAHRQQCRGCALCQVRHCCVLR